MTKRTHLNGMKRQGDSAILAVLAAIHMVPGLAVASARQTRGLGHLEANPDICVEITLPELPPKQSPYVVSLERIAEGRCLPGEGNPRNEFDPSYDACAFAGVVVPLNYEWRRAALRSETICRKREHRDSSVAEGVLMTPETLLKAKDLVKKAKGALGSEIVFCSRVHLVGVGEDVDDSEFACH